MIICSYCDASNVAGSMCIACGAPLPELPPELSQGAADRPDPVQISSERQALRGAREAGEKFDKLTHAALYVYSALWRALAEAIVIALLGLGLGVVGGAVGQAVGGVLSALVALLV